MPSHFRNRLRPYLIVAPVCWFVWLGGAAHAANARPEVTIDPGGVPPTVLQAITASVDHIVSLSQDQDGGEVDRLRRRARDVAITALATEGYFDPRVTLDVGTDVAGETWDITIEPGKRAEVVSVDLRFEGAVTLPQFAQRIEQARKNWGLPEGQPFRNEQWESAKRNLITSIAETDFALARIETSEALVNPDEGTAKLSVNIASGPQVLLGDMNISGLRRVPESLVHRYVEYQPEVTPYDRRQLITWQQDMQATAFFSSVDVVLDTPGGRRRGATPQQAADAAAEAAEAGDLDAVQPVEPEADDGVPDVEDEADAEADEAIDTRATETDEAREDRARRMARFMERESITVPLRVDVMEGPARRLGLSLGVDSDVGFRAETLYQQNVVAGRAVELRTGIGLNKKQRTGFLDIYLPPEPRGYRNRFGLLVESSDIQGQDVRRAALGAVRTQTRRGAGDSRAEYETSFGLIASYEKVRYPGESYTLPSLVATFDWLRRDVDNKYNPREGHLIGFGAGVGSALNHADPFTRAQARAQYWWPIGKRDLITVRGEIGNVWASSSIRVPSDFGFRTGGARTIRGYRYLGLGREVDGAILGARSLAVASVEYQHFFTDMLGMGVFVDAGDAAQSFRQMDIAVGVGAGLRVRTPAGPIFVDLAYAERDKRLRLSFSLGIAF